MARSSESSDDGQKKLKWVLRSRRNFLIFSVCCWGLPMAVFSVWMVWTSWGIKSIAFSIFVVLVALGGGCIWGVLMWGLFVGPRLEVIKSVREQNARRSGDKI